MSFSINTIKLKKNNSIGEIRIDDFCETFEMPMLYWRSGDYEKQWTEALRRLIEGENTSSLVTSILDPTYSNFIFWWPLYRFGEQVKIHNQILFFNKLDGPFEIKNLYRHIPPYLNKTEDGEEVSEWVTSVSALETFLNRP